MRPPLRVGLTGGIASGKSHVLRRLAERGCRTLDLDAVARRVTGPGTPALAEIVEAFGPGVIDGAGKLDRAALGHLVFGDRAARERLNRIVHPRVRAAEAAWAAAHASDTEGVLVTDGALLIESGVHLRFDRLVVAHCTPELQLRRLRERDGLDEAAALARIEAQLPSSTKREFAHYEVDTSGPPSETDSTTDELAAELADLAGRERDPDDRKLVTFVGGLVHGSAPGARGLSAQLLLRQAAAGPLDLQAFAQRLQPPAPGPWYAAATPAPLEAASRMSVAAAAFAQAYAGSDPAFAAAAAASLTRLTHDDAASRADATLVALVALEVAAGPGHGWQERASRWTALATRFGGPPSERQRRLFMLLDTSIPADPAAAAAAAARQGIDGPTVAALAGLGASVPSDAREGWLRALLDVRNARAAP